MDNSINAARKSLWRQMFRGAIVIPITYAAVSRILAIVIRGASYN